MSKSAVGPMNSRKNKLNSEIILIFNLYPNAHLIERFSITLAQKIQIKSVGVKHRLIHCPFVTYIWDWY